MPDDTFDCNISAWCDVTLIYDADAKHVQVWMASYDTVTITTVFHWRYHSYIVTYWHHIIS